MTFLDWASTSPVVRFTANKTRFTLSKYDVQYCNPNAAYAYTERQMLMDCETRIKRAIGIKGGHVLYFRCATEAIKWLVNAVGGSRLAWSHSPYEHDSCLFGATARPSEIIGADFYIHQWANHITGEIFNLKKIREELDDDCRLIVDATAGFGKAKLPSGLEDVASALFMSGHKIGCPDLSFMWLNDELCEWLGAAKDIRNQWGLHHGSLTMASVLALADAVEWACDEAGCVNGHSIDLYVGMDNLLYEVGVEHHDVLSCKVFAAAINAIRLNGINADALQQFLATRGIYVGVGGSACSAAHDYRVLVNGYGLTENEASEVIRVSFGAETTVDDIKALVDGIKEYRQQFC